MVDPDPQASNALALARRFGQTYQNWSHKPHSN